MRAQSVGAVGGAVVNREELFDKHLRGELSADETAELKHLLANDADAGRAFVEHVNETALIVRVGSQLQSAQQAENIVPLELSGAEPEKLGTRGIRPSAFWRMAALAACLAALLSIPFLLDRSEPPVRKADVSVTGTGMQVSRGEEMLGGVSEIELLAGDIITTASNQTATIVYANESTRLEIQPGGVIKFDGLQNGKRFELRTGIIEARVAPQPVGQPLRIKTAQAEATVLGTEFFLRADDRGTRLDVLEGKVEMACRVSGKKSVVKSGFAATLNPSKPSFNVSALCSSNCILRECRGSNAASKLQKLKKNDEN
jgi:ferric-dicitrate binding protein FerR (iron transport regulator)